jgi:hypothetical protein
MTTDGGSWRGRTAARGLCVGLNNAGVASIPEDVVGFTRRSESNASEWPGSMTGSREVKATDGKQRELRKIEPSPVRRNRNLVQAAGDQGALCWPEQRRGNIHT